MWEQLRGGQAAKVIRRWEQLELRVAQGTAETVAREQQYFENYRERWDLRDGEEEELAVEQRSDRIELAVISLSVRVAGTILECSGE